MATVILKAAPCMLKTGSGLIELKGYSALNFVDEGTLKAVRELNPEFNTWLENGYAVIGGSVDKAKADVQGAEEKAAAERSRRAAEEAKAVVKAARDKGR